MATPPTPSTPSTSTPSSSMGDVTFDVIMAQLQHMDACLDALNDELCQVNTRVSRIAKQQARLGGFVKPPSPPPEASEDDDDSNTDNDDEDGNANSSNADKMST